MKKVLIGFVLAFVGGIMAWNFFDLSFANFLCLACLIVGSLLIGAGLAGK